MRWLFLLVLVLPALEIGMFIWIGGKIGPWYVILLILLTGIIGISIARWQGLQTWRDVQWQLSQGQVPTKQIIDGVCIFIGGIFLLSPGFITDTIGLIFVIPLTRRFIRQGLYIWLKRSLERGTIIFRRW
ncbi:membrane protein FxsA [Compostibacillus humi]|uniref:Membrane protein FxsA n=1 Tax=Compostibacillus humi TaxID=1245525 RepID=A0A8J2ZSP1_9BACI|nr:FxsA family protein [Compostibacillus humi]GGH75656.1 membrane protein FxsA [Compostibacillus humi]